MIKKIEHQHLLEILSYDKDSGIFLWKKTGQLAGYVHAVRGHVYIEINGKAYLAHRLAWFYMTGEWPKDEIDHIDRNRKNNSFMNLREASHSQNQHNSGIRKDNKSGFRGVSKSGKKWMATIAIKGKNNYLGVFDTAEAAYSAYVAKAKELRGCFAGV